MQTKTIKVAEGCTSGLTTTSKKFCDQDKYGFRVQFRVLANRNRRDGFIVF